MSTPEELAKKRLKEGWLHVLATFEVIGKPKEHVEETIQQLVETVKKEETIQVLEEHIDDAVATENDFFSTFAEVDMMVKNVETLTWLAANITPATIEIIEPLNFSFTAGDMQGWINDVLSTMHSIGYAHKTQNAELQFIKGQLRTLVENTILINLAKGAKAPAAISKETSIDLKAVEAHLGALEKAERVKKDGELYTLAK